MMRCGSCSNENPPEAVYCLKCGRALSGAQSGPATPTKEFVTQQAQSAVTKMLSTPGTMVLALGLFLLMLSLLFMVFSIWAGIGVLAISIVMLLVAVQWRGHEARIAAARGASLQTVVQSEVHEREVVKVKCRYCGSLNPDGARNCGSCGSLI